MFQKIKTGHDLKPLIGKGKLGRVGGRESEFREIFSGSADGFGIKINPRYLKAGPAIGDGRRQAAGPAAQIQQTAPAG